MPSFKLRRTNKPWIVDDPESNCSLKAQSTWASSRACCCGEATVWVFRSSISPEPGVGGQTSGRRLGVCRLGVTQAAAAAASGSVSMRSGEPLVGVAATSVEQAESDVADVDGVGTSATQAASSNNGASVWTAASAASQRCGELDWLHQLFGDAVAPQAGGLSGTSSGTTSKTLADVGVEIAAGGILAPDLRAWLVARAPSWTTGGGGSLPADVT
mmetsp:Transcript_8620/g.24821  ORF Transcript_8620/g.24821 Transcript_8620/m.24821 type:complete len:215 (-) Transcript_8620:255-899(-)